MAYIVDQQSNFKHFCKICKKGFGCGRALGGHMRAHGIGDESGHIDDEDLASDWEEKLGANDPPSNKRMYALRTNPNRLKSCRVCENCGKEFLSWKSFLEHGKCSTSEDAESLVSSPGSDGEDGSARRGCGWSKKKRSLRTKIGNYNSNNTPCPSSEEEELANCLMMLSNATVDPLEAEPEESCASASKELEERRNNTMNFIASVACRSLPLDHNKAKGVASTKGMFECKACKKVFNSHQALGGHRASHKKVKGCFAARLDHMDDSLVDEDHDVITNEDFFPTNHNHHKSTATNLQFDHGINTPALPSTSKRKSKVHECSICHRVFSSGQALGGHKRCHWITSNSPADTSSLAKFHNQFSSSNNINNNNNINIHDQMEQHHLQQPRQKFVDNNNINNSDPLDLKLDLNLPAPVIDHDPAAGLRREQVNTSSFDVSTEIYLQPWINVDAKEKNKDHNHDHNQINQTVKIDKNGNRNNCSSSMQINVEDEADSKVKLAKLSELKDMNASGSSSPWLQVGIGSTTNDVGTDQL